MTSLTIPQQTDILCILVVRFLKLVLVQVHGVTDAISPPTGCPTALTLVINTNSPSTTCCPLAQFCVEFCYGLCQPNITVNAARSVSNCERNCKNSNNCQSLTYYTDTTRCELFQYLPSNYQPIPKCTNYVAVGQSVSTANCVNPTAAPSWASVAANNMPSLQQMINNGYVLVQQRLDGGMYFNKTWAQFASGFGSYSGAYWIGNNQLNQLTNAGSTCLAHFDLQQLVSRNWYWTEYTSIKVDTPSNFYKLSIGTFSGTSGFDDGVHACDDGTDANYPCSNGGQGCPSENGNCPGNHNLDGYGFSTWDQDHSVVTDQCAQKNWGAFWYQQCTRASINGVTGQNNNFAWGIKTDGTQYLQASRLWIKC